MRDYACCLSKHMFSSCAASMEMILVADDSPQSLGGQARSQSLSREQRKEIARQGALARWNKAAPVVDPDALPEATHQGELPIGDVKLDCYVLEDGRRLFHKRGMARALTLKSDGG